jgi:RNA polymerase sigma-70 factor (ECF subfamily)
MAQPDVDSTSQRESPPRYASATLTAELLTRAAKGDQSALRSVYDQTSRLLFALALRILGSREEASEVLQEVYLDIWRKAIRYDPGRMAPLPWLVTVTRNRAVDRVRTRATHDNGAVAQAGDGNGAELPHAVAPVDSISESERRRAVGKALAELPRTQRQVLELAFYDGLTDAEIAAKLREPAGTITTRIKVGMSKLKVTLGSNGD